MYECAAQRATESESRRKNARNKPLLIFSTQISTRGTLIAAGASLVMMKPERHGEQPAHLTSFRHPANGGQGEQAASLAANPSTQSKESGWS